MDNPSNLLDCVVPRLVFVDEPENTFRFRYQSEKRHGCLKSKNHRGPEGQSIRLRLDNYDHSLAVIRCTPVTETSLAPHAHRLDYDPHGDSQEVEVSATGGWIATFSALTIVCTDRRNNKRNVKEILMRRLKKEKPGLTSVQFYSEVDRLTDLMDYNRLRLKFQALTIDRKQLIGSPIYSQTIQNSRGNLRIVRVDKTSGICSGGDEVFIFVTKVDKMDIEIRFFELDGQKRVIWTDKGDFSSLDVWYQCAIAFKTPPYWNPNIEEPVTVQYQLHRPRTGCRSDPRSFTYIPRNVSQGRAKRPHTGTWCLDFPHLPFQLESVDVSNHTIHPPQCPTVDESRLDAEPSVKSLPFFNETGWSTGTCSMIPSSTPTSKEPTDNNIPFTTVDFDLLLGYESDECVHCAFDDWRCGYPSPSGLPPSAIARPTSQLSILKNQPLRVAQLLTNGADPTVLDSKGYSPIHTAAGLGSSECLSVLLNFKSNPCDLKLNQASYDGLTALHLAVKCGNLRNIELLVSKGVDVNVAELRQGKTALHMAVEMRDKRIVNYLLQNPSLDVNKQSYNGTTPIHLSMAAALDDITEALVNLGADSSIEHFLPGSFESKCAVDDAMDH